MNSSQITIQTEDGRVYYDMTGAENPCAGCGACCRHYRVSFYHGELDTQPGGYVPADLCAPLTPFRACMKGTETGGRCIALQDDMRCGIYENRPSVCREFPAFMADGAEIFSATTNKKGVVKVEKKSDIGRELSYLIQKQKFIYASQV